MELKNLELALNNEFKKKLSRESRLNTLKNMKVDIWEFVEFNYAEMVLLDNLNNVINLYEMSIKESINLIEIYKNRIASLARPI
jgi:hypothetical protein